MIDRNNCEWGVHTSELDPKKQEGKCKGLIFRGKLNTFFSIDKYVYQESMVLLKKKSCPGCQECQFLLDDLPEMLDRGNLINDFEDGALYKLEMSNVITDWETGHADDWGLLFNKIKNH